MDQINMFSGAELRDKGIKKASEHAESKDHGWNDKAFDLLVEFVPNYGVFMAEDARKWAHAQGLPEPPTARAWGAVIVKAAKLGIIRRVGFASVANPKAHNTPASVWKRT